MSTGEFPTARRASVMFVHDHRLMLWGGMTQVIMGEGDGRIIVDIDIPGIYVVSLVSRLLCGHARAWERG